MWKFAFAVELVKSDPSISQEQALRIAETIFPHASQRTPQEAAKDYPFADPARSLAD